jgi:hypothetical protein
MNNYDLIMRAGIFKGLQQRKFPMFQLFGMAQQMDAVKQGNLIMQMDPVGNHYLAPAPTDPNAPVDVKQPDGSTATVHTPVQESDVDAKIDAVRTEMVQFTNKAVGQSETRVKDAIAKSEASVLSAVKALNPPKPPKKVK